MIDPRKSHVFAVGIGSYDLGNAWRLQKAADNALAFAAFARKRGVPRDAVHLFLSTADRTRLAADIAAADVDARVATHSVVNEFIFKELTKLEGELLYMFWAGHGSLSEDGARALFFEDLSQVDQRHLDLRDFFATLRTSAFQPFRTQIAFVDACANRFEELGFAVSLAEARAGKGLFTLPDVRQMFFLAADAGEQARDGEFGAAVLRALQDVAAERVEWPPDQDAVVSRVRPQFEDASQRPVQLVWTTASGDEYGREFASGDLPASPSVNAAATARQLPVRALRRLADIALQYDKVAEVGDEGAAQRTALFASIATPGQHPTAPRRSTPRLQVLHLVGAALKWNRERQLADAIGALGGFDFDAELDRIEHIRKVRQFVATLPATSAQLRADFLATTTRQSHEREREEALSLDAMLDELFQTANAAEPLRPVWEFLLRLARRFDRPQHQPVLAFVVAYGASKQVLLDIDAHLRTEERFVLSIDVGATYDVEPAFDEISARLVVADTLRLVRAFPAQPVRTWDDLGARVAAIVSDARRLVLEQSGLREEALLIEFLLPAPFLTHEPHALPCRVAGIFWPLGQLHPVVVRLRERTVQRHNAINLAEWEDIARRIDRSQSPTVHWMERSRAEPTIATCKGVVALRFLPEDELLDIVFDGFPFIAWWRSEPEAGDWDAFVKGFQAWTGNQRLCDLARAVRTIRRKPTDLGARLTLFWDDPGQSGYWPRLDEVATGGD